MALYQALDLKDASQLAVFGDGVGTSSIKVPRVLGLALGVGVKRNVLNLYKFLCRNHQDGDRIWAFGFSRGAFTIRVLGLIYREGLVSFKTEAELHRNALVAYRSYRRKAFPTMIPWVAVGRAVRDVWVSAWNYLTDARPYADRKGDHCAQPETDQRPFRRRVGHARRIRTPESTNSPTRPTSGSGR